MKKDELKQVDNYILSISEALQKLYEAGIEELDCLGSEEMLEILNRWINDKNQGD